MTPHPCCPPHLGHWGCAVVMVAILLLLFLVVVVLKLLEVDRISPRASRLN